MFNDEITEVFTDDALSDKITRPLADNVIPVSANVRRDHWDIILEGLIPGQ